MKVTLIYNIAKIEKKKKKTIKKNNNKFQVSSHSFHMVNTSTVFTDCIF